MQLVGMLDSPYVRRTAISLTRLGVGFEHRAVSVFSTFEQFQSINPVVKAPTLVCDDGEVLMDSTLIIQYAEALVPVSKSLMPTDLKPRQNALRVIGLSLAACEKSVQIVYELNLRPAEKHHEPWLARVRGQLLAAYAALEREISRLNALELRKPLMQAHITAAVAWQFTQSMLADIVAADKHPALQQLSVIAEQTPEFLSFPPVGPGV